VAYTADLENDGKTISSTLPIQFTSNELDSKISLSLGKPSDQFEEELRLTGRGGRADLFHNIKQSTKPSIYSSMTLAIGKGNGNGRLHGSMWK
jgi:hypothetical protein